MAIGEPLEGHMTAVECVCFSPDGKYIVSGSLDKTIRIWNVETGQAIGGPLQGHTGSIETVSFSPNGNYIVSGAEDNTICIWNSYTGRAVGEPLEGHTDDVRSIKFSPDSRHIVSGSRDHTVCVWDILHTSVVFSPHQSHCLWNANYLAAETEITEVLAIHIRLEKSGWLVGPGSKLLMWIPPEYRTKLWRPSMRAVIGRNMMSLDLSKFAHGPDWAQCRKKL